MANLSPELTRAHNKAKVGVMVQGSVFLSTILFSLKHEFTDQVKTASTDGLGLWINPDWYMKLTSPQRIGLLAHEAWHCAFEHMERQGNKNHDRWNIAGDHLINLQLLSQGFQIPPNGHHDSAFRNMSTQQIYDALPDDPGNPMYFEFDGDLKEPDPSDPKAAEKEIARTNIIIKAITQSKMSSDKPGTVPQEISVKIQELISPVLPWKDLLQRFLTARSNDDYTWTRPNKRFSPEFHLPSAYSESLASLAIAIDTSGSVTDEQLVEFLSEIDYIHQVMKPEKLTIIDFDTRIKAEHVLEQGQSVTEIELHGRGGTNIRPVLDWGVANNPTALLIFTDGYFSKDYPQNIEYPIQWIIYGGNDFKFPVGEIVAYD